MLLVTHQAAPMTMRVQGALYQSLRSLHPQRVHWLPVNGTLVGRPAAETTQRSRSFLFAALGYAAASLLKVRRVRFFENGVVSVNLPISRQVIGTMATRTTHPRTLQLIGEVLKRIADDPIEIDNPYARMTKSEVVAHLRDLGGAGLIGETRSCSGVRQRTVEHPHCGCCSQCLDRRFAVLAAGRCRA